MEESFKKLKSLLEFYKDNEEEIELKVRYRGGVTLRGKIIKTGSLFNKGIVISSFEGSLIKIYLEDIELESVFPIGFLKNKKIKKENRDSISPKLRFAVLRRDKYVCQYCGACGPETELEVDHKIPVSRGGTDEMENLVTSCIKCNRGKGNRV